jgi:Transposase, Mutator family
MASATPTGSRVATAIGAGLGHRVGSIELAIPRLRAGSYFPSFLEPRRRSEQALVAVVQEAYVNGVSTRKVDRLVEALGLAGVSKDQVSRLCGGLQVTALRERPLGSTYPYLWLDAKVEKVRRRPSGAPGPVGRLRRPRHRPPRGHRPGRGRGRDPGAFWREFLRSLAAPAAFVACSWWSPTLTKASSRRSPRCSALHGNDARCISCATRSGTAPRTCSSWSARRSARSSEPTRSRRLGGCWVRP